MNRGDIIERFRQENPEITTNVASDAVLQSWCEIGNAETAVRARLIKGSTTFAATADEETYNLVSRISKFYDIDELPGGGVAYNDKRLKLTTPAQLDAERPSWRTASSGTPNSYYRRNENIYLVVPPSGTSDITIDAVLLADDLDDDSKEPFNGLANLKPFHYALVLYLKMRAFGGKVKKKDTSMTAKEEYEDYIDWIKKENQRGIYQEIKIRPSSGYRSTSRRR